LKTQEDQRNLDVQRIRLAKRKFAGISSASLVIALGVAAVLAIYLSGVFHYSLLRLGGLFGAGIVLAWSVTIAKIGENNAALEQWNVYQRFRKMKKWIVVFLATIGGGILSNFIYDMLRG
jgi:hypothetical protein